MANDAFEKLKSSVNRGITTISVKTSSSLEKSKIKTHIETLEKEIERLYRNVGEAMYIKWQQGEVDLALFQESLEAVKQKKQEIEALTKEMQDLDERNNQILGTANEEPPQIIKEETKYVCSKCGAQYASSVNFCRKCGNKMSE